MKKSRQRIIAIILLFTICMGLMPGEIMSSLFTVKSSAADVKNHYVASFKSSITGEQFQTGFFYENEFFEQPASTMSQNLALSSASLASITYKETSIKTVLKEMGFNNVKSYYYNKATKEDNDWVGFVIGSKDINISTGKYSLYAIFIRGTAGNTEWYSNFNMGKGKYHTGFNTAAKRVLKCIKDNNLIPTNKTNNKIWITGHSRGAAVANLIASSLSCDGTMAKPDNIYCYTYACPNVSTETSSYKYNNIFNFNNPCDIITELPLSSWGYSRFGKTIIMPTSGEIYNNLTEKFNVFTGETFAGNSNLNAVLKQMKNWLPTINKYYDKGLLNYSAKDMFFDVAELMIAKTNTVLDKLAVGLDAVSLMTKIGLSGYKGSQDVFSFFIYEGKLTDKVAHAHCQETYISWMNSAYNNSLTKETEKSVSNVVSNLFADMTEKIKSLFDSLTKTIKGSSVNVVPNKIVTYSYKSGLYKVVATDGINYRKGAGTEYASYGYIKCNTRLLVTNISGCWGKTKYNGKDCWVCLLYCSYLGNIEKPAPPAVTVETSKEIGVGETINLSWNKVQYAEKYNITVKDKNSGEIIKEVKSTDKTSIFFAVNKACELVFFAQSYNEFYMGDIKQFDTVIIVHPDVNITFYKDDNVYQQQSITWNHSLTSMPEIPSQKGNAFAGWYLEDMTTFASFSSIKQDLDVYAKFVPSSYTVKFETPDGTLIKSEKVNYGEAAAAPDESEFISLINQNGRKFIGWNKDFSCVTSSITVTAVTDAENQNIPVEITDVSAVRYEKNYVVTCNVNNLTRKDVENGRVIAALKTEEGKLITTNESAAFFLDKNYNDINGDLVTNSEKIKIVVPIIAEKSEDSEVETITATVAEVYTIQDYHTTVPISSNVVVEIEDRDPWTDWSLVKDDNYSVENTETNVQYRSRELQKTTTSNEAERNRLIDEGWVQYNSESSKDKNSGTWSKTKPQTGTNGIDYATKVVTDKAASTVYKYKRYKYYNSSDGNYWYSYGSTWATNRGFSGKWEYKTSGSPLDKTGSVDGWNIYKGTWFSDSEDKNDPKVTTAAVTHTEYRVFDTVTTYYLNKWPDEFSDWSTTPMAGNDIVDVETRTIYRYKKADLERIEDNTGYIRNEFTYGNLGTEYAGKQVALIIYKINEASDWTTEHIAQTEVLPNGTYRFSSYKLREEPSEVTGDMTVVLGVEGAEDVIFLGKIEAPKPKCVVTFVDDLSGEIISTQTVEKGSDAVVPDTSVYEGYKFSHWNNCSTNIQSDLEIRAIYEKNIYTVVWIDYVQNKYEMQTYEHGQNLEPPFGLIETCDMIPDGWDEYTTDISIPVTQSMIITAKYLYKTFTVDFLDCDMNVFETQTVRYGQTLEFPDISYYEDDDHIIYGFTSVEEILESADSLLKASENGNILLSAGEPAMVYGEEVESCGIDSGLDNEYIIPESYEVYNDCQILPVFEYTQTAEAPTLSVATGSYSASQTVSMETATDRAVIFYTTDGSDPATSNTAREYTAPVTINKSCELRCCASKVGMNTSDETIAYYAIGNNDHILKYGIDDDIVYIAIVSDRSKAPSDFLVDDEGSIFEGVYTDSEMTTEWNIDYDTVTADTTLYINYTEKEYIVDFIDHNGLCLDSQMVTYLESAEEPEAPSRIGYVFVGWDSDDYKCVTEDLTLTAQYVKESEYYRVTISSTEYTTMTDSAFTLFAAASNASGEEGNIIWFSSDDSIAGVDENGTVYAFGTGEAIIYAECAENGEKAECKVTVCANPSKSLLLAGTASAKLDANGYLRNIQLITDEEEETNAAETVGSVKDQFNNPSSNIKVYSKNGILLQDNEPIRTGSVIKLYSSDKVVDEITVVIAGDIDGDGYVSNRDAAWITRYLVNKEAPDNAQLTAMDVNGDGYVNNRDAALIARYLVGKETL